MADTFKVNLSVSENEIDVAFFALSSVEFAKSTKDKNALLQKYSMNSVLKTLLYYALNQFKQYYIKLIPDVAPMDSKISADNYIKFIELLDDLSKRVISGNKITYRVSEFLKYCNRTEQLWYTRVIKRSLEIGMAEKAVNKAYSNYIPVYDVLLANRVEDVTLTDIKTLRALPERFVIQYKIDGYRLNIHKTNDGNVLIRTRSGLPVYGYDMLETEARIYLPKGYVYDGEMVSPKLLKWIEQNMLCDSSEKIADRRLFQEAISNLFAKEENKLGVFNMFDMVNINDWDAQKSSEIYSERNSNLNNIIKPITDLRDISQMTVVPTSRVFNKNNKDDMAEVIKIFHKFLSWGWEGLMIKAVDATYEWKRSNSVLKMKLMDTADLTVLSVIEAGGMGVGSIGKLVCDYKGTELNISTGKLSMQEKIDFLKNPNLIVGKTIEVAYQAESIGKNGEPVLDFCQYKQTRKDK